MAKTIRLVCFSFCIAVVSFSQPLTDILINDEPNTNNFKALDAALYCFSPDSFLATWHDDRSNGKFAWAQFFDGQATKRSDVFRIAGNTLVVPYGDNSYAVVDYRFYDAAPVSDPLWIGRMQNYFGLQPVGRPVTLGVHVFPFCGTGFVGIGQDFVRTTWGGVHADNFGGYLTWAIQNDLGSDAPLSWNEVLFEDYFPVYTADSFDLCPTPDLAEVFLIFCTVNVSAQGEERAGLHFIRIGESTDAPLPRRILADSSLVLSYDDNSFLSARFLDADVIHLLWTKQDSLVEIKMDTSGSIHFRQATPIPMPDSPDFTVDNSFTNSFLRSNVRNGRSHALIGVTQYGARGGQGEIRNYFAVYTLENGLLSAEAPRLIPVGRWQTKQTFGDAFLQENGMLLLQGVRDGRAWLFQLDDEQIVDSTKLSSEAPGDNQRRPHIVPETDQSFWITYDQQSKRRGRRLLVNGRLEATTALPYRRGIFLENGRTFATVGRPSQSHAEALAVQFYNVGDWTLRSERPVSGLGRSAHIGKLDENRFYVVSRLDSNITRLKTFHADGTFLDSLSASCRTVSYYGDIASFPLPNGKIWLRTYRYFLWDPARNTIEEAVSLPRYFPGFPISEDKFLLVRSSIQWDEPSFRSTFSIVGANGEELIKDYRFPGGDRFFSVLPLSEEYFLIFYQTNEQQYHFRVFDHSFHSILKEEPFPHATLYSGEATAQTVGSHVIFAISDMRNDVAGQDIYASIFDLHDIIVQVADPPPALPLTFELSYPSPNPVQTDQRVRFYLDVPEKRYFEIAVYNILGKQVGEIKKQHYAKGRHEIDFPLDNLAAGLYFVKAATGSRSMVQKMVVVSK